MTWNEANQFCGSIGTKLLTVERIDLLDCMNKMADKDPIASKKLRIISKTIMFQMLQGTCGRLKENSGLRERVMVALEISTGAGKMSSWTKMTPGGRVVTQNPKKAASQCLSLKRYQENYRTYPLRYARKRSNLFAR